MSNGDDGVTRAVKDITAGSIGGIAQVLTGQPFDIVKVHKTHRLKQGFFFEKEWVCGSEELMVGAIADSGDGVFWCP